MQAGQEREGRRLRIRPPSVDISHESMPNTRTRSPLLKTNVSPSTTVRLLAATTVSTDEPPDPPATACCPEDEPTADEPPADEPPEDEASDEGDTCALNGMSRSTNPNAPKRMTSSNVLLRGTGSTALTSSRALRVDQSGDEEQRKDLSSDPVTPPGVDMCHRSGHVPAQSAYGAYGCSRGIAGFSVSRLPNLDVNQPDEVERPGSGQVDTLDLDVRQRPSTSDCRREPQQRSDRREQRVVFNAPPLRSTTLRGEHTVALTE